GWPLRRRNLDEAAVVPADAHGRVCVRDRFLAHVLAAAVVYLLIGALVDPEREDQPAARLQLVTGHLFALERQLLPHAGKQQMAVDAVLGVARAKSIGGV